MSTVSRARRLGSGRFRPLVAVVVLLLALAAPAGAQQTPGLVETRERVDQIARDYQAAEAELAEIELRVATAEGILAEYRSDFASREDEVVRAAVESFRTAGSGGAVGDPTGAIRYETLRSAAIGVDADALETYRAVFEDFALVEERLAEDLARADELIEQLADDREELVAELARLEELERERLAEEARREEEARRRAAEEAAAAAATAAASSSSGSGSSSDSGSSTGASSDTSGSSSDGGTAEEAAPAPEPEPAAPTAAAPSTGTALQYCPVAGPHHFIDSWGYPRSGGRRHKGVDMMANIGVPIVAPVSGSVSHRANSLGGRSFHLNGDDGNYYYGTHLSAYGESGWVAAGTVIGYVGDDGNARGIPHLHFEVHPGGGSAVNPYPYVAAVC